MAVPTPKGVAMAMAWDDPEAVEPRSELIRERYPNRYSILALRGNGTPQLLPREFRGCVPLATFQICPGEYQSGYRFELALFGPKGAPIP